MQDVNLIYGTTYVYNEEGQLVPIQTVLDLSEIKNVCDENLVKVYLDQQVSDSNEIKFIKSAAGGDVHKRFITVSVVVSLSDRAERLEFVRQFHVNRTDLNELVCWLSLFPQFDTLAIEATANYWKPVTRHLSKHGFVIKLLNPMTLKYIVKTDVKDALKMARLNHDGYLKMSFIAGKIQEELRRQSRLMRKFINLRTGHLNRIADELTRKGITLLNLIKIGSVSALLMIKGIINDETRDEIIYHYKGDKYASPCGIEKLKDSLYELENFSDSSRRILARLMTHVELYEQHILEHEAEIIALIKQIEMVCPTTGEIISGERLMEIIKSMPRVANRTAYVILAELGWEIARFPTAGHCAAYGGFVPNNKITGGKKKRTESRAGNKHLHSALTEVAQQIVNGWAGNKTILTRLAFDYMAKSNGNKLKAIGMIGRRLMQGLWHMIMKNEEWREPDLANQQRRRKQQKAAKKTLDKYMRIYGRLDLSKIPEEEREEYRQMYQDLARAAGLRGVSLSISTSFSNCSLEVLSIPKRAKTALLAAGHKMASDLVMLVLSETLVKTVKGIGETLQSKIIESLKKIEILVERPAAI